MDRELIAEQFGGGILFADGFDEAFVGIAHKANGKSVACYDMSKCLSILQSRDGMSLQDAMEFFEYNVLGAYMGDQTPCFLERVSESGSVYVGPY